MQTNQDKVNLKLHIVRTGREYPIAVSKNSSGNDILKVILNNPKLNIEKFDHKSRPIEYSLSIKLTGEILGEVSLGGINIKENDTLVLETKNKQPSFLQQNKSKIIKSTIIGLVILIPIIIFFAVRNSKSGYVAEKKDINYEKIDYEKDYLGKIKRNDKDVNIELKIYNKEGDYFDYDIIIVGRIVLQQKKGKIDTKKKEIQFPEDELDTKGEKKIINEIGDAKFYVNSINKIVIQANNKKWKVTQLN